MKPFTCEELIGFRALRDCGALMVRPGAATKLRYGGLRDRGLITAWPRSDGKVLLRLTANGMKRYPAIADQPVPKLVREAR